MTQISRKTLPKEINARIYDIFTKVIADANSSQDVEALLNDFLTPVERVMLPKRLSIAYLLIKKYDQRTIASYLNVSFSTITRVSTSLKANGSGYRTMLKRIAGQERFASILDAIEKGIIDILASAGGPSRVWKNIQKKQRADNPRFPASIL